MRVSGRRFRPAAPSDLDRLVSIAIRSYPVPERPEDSIRDAFADNPWSRWEDIVVGEVDGLHVAQAFLHPFTLGAWGATFGAGGLGSVAVAADHRRQGWARDLVRHCQQVAADRGWPFIILYPFRPDFYRRLGWGIAECRGTVHVRADAIPPADGADRVRAATVAEAAELVDVYHAWAKHRNGFLVRDPGAWLKRLLRQPPFVGIYHGASGIEGYVLYRIEGIGPNFLHQKVIVTELVWTTDVAWRALWGFVGRQSDQVAEVVYEPRGDDGFIHHLENASLPGTPIVGGGFHRIGERVVGTMAKIIDPAAVARARRYGPGRGAIRITVSDPLFADRQETFELEVADGEGRIGSGGKSDGILITSSATWAAVQCGALSLRHAHRLGQVEITGEVDIAVWSETFATDGWGIFEMF
jgi:predicted acetyltransferase